jgi:aminopeptidase YwaD
MNRVWRLVILASLLWGIAGHRALPVQAQAAASGSIAAARALPDLLPPRTGDLLKALDGRFDQKAAMDLVVFMDRFWRNAGNTGFNASGDRIRERLVTAGFAVRAPGAAPNRAATWNEDYPANGRGWEYTVGTLTLLGAHGTPDEVLLSREGQRVALCINSFSTPPAGVTAPVVDVGSGASDADYERTDVKGAVIIGDAGTGRLWQLGVVKRGALGVISTALAPYVRPGSTDADLGSPRQSWDVLQWGSVPYDENRRAFGFKATPRAASRIRTRLASGPAEVRVEIASSFANLAARTLVAEIPGAVVPEERILLAAHIQEPGANDNASGCATLAELARAIRKGIKDGKFPPPARTLTFLWVDEIRGSRRWMTDHADQAKRVRYMLSLDMTGEDAAKTGGPFLIEKAPDPTAVWARPSDPHTEWGESDVKADSLKGTLLNDLFLAVCLRHAGQSGWVVGTNPYEGGSDHSVFLAAGVPAVLAWHFPDRFYHTSLDRPDKTSPLEMRRVGVAMAATALLLAGPSVDDAQAIIRLLGTAARDRLALEDRQGRELVSNDKDQPAAKAREDSVRAAWVRWYADALQAVLSLPPRGETPELRLAVDRAVAQLGK